MGPTLVPSAVPVPTRSMLVFDRTINRMIRKYLLLLLISLFCVSCSTLVELKTNSPQEIEKSVAIDDLVEIDTVDGRSLSLVVTAIDDQYIEGAEEKVKLNEITKISKRKADDVASISMVLVVKLLLAVWFIDAIF